MLDNVDKQSLYGRYTNLLILQSDLVNMDGQDDGFHVFNIVVLMPPLVF
jgi:hypothetical protein